MPTMSNSYLKKWTQQTRARLILELGGKCVSCGTGNDLQFDHINGRDWDLEKTSQWARLSRIKREMKQGNIQLLCGSCNRKKA